MISHRTNDLACPGLILIFITTLEIFANLFERSERRVVPAQAILTPYGGCWLSLKKQFKPNHFPSDGVDANC